MFKKIIKMARFISNVIVDKISLVKKWENPAVEKAETKFSIFKTFKKTKINKTAIEKIEKIKEKYQKIKKTL